VINAPLCYHRSALGATRGQPQEAAMIIEAMLKDDNGNTLAKIVANEKTFATGSRGFHGQGKIEIDGKRYQVQVQLVEIGSKEGSKSKS
jgi:hypothetical protein